MKLTDQDIELIERYLDQDLHDQELSVFENRLRDDAAFNRAVEEFKLIFQGIKAEAQSTLIQDMQAWDQTLGDVNTVSAPSKIRTLATKYWNYASAAVVLLAMVLRVNFGVMQHFVPAVDLLSYRSDDTSSMLTMQEGLALGYYTNEQYRKAIKVFEEIEPKNEVVWFYLGNCYLEKKKFKKALECFEQDILIDNPIYRHDAIWYSSLCYVALRQNKEAHRNLKIIEQSQGKNSERAKVLLSKRRFNE